MGPNLDARRAERWSASVAGAAAGAGAAGAGRAAVTLVTVLAVLYLTVVGAPARAAEARSPVGTWTTFDESTGKPSALVRIDDSAGTLTGRIVKFFPGPGEDANPVCHACTDARHDQPIVGMLFLSGLKRETDSDVWSGGEVLDPDSGQVYRCRITLSPDGKTLQVRGFIGFALLGRTETWTRAAD